MSDERNDGLHPRHPGRGKPTSLIALEGPSSDLGGFLIFFPSGGHMSLSWRHAGRIPEFEGAKTFAEKIVTRLLEDGSLSASADIAETNWASVTAAIQRIVGDWNEGVTSSIKARMSELH